MFSTTAGLFRKLFLVTVALALGGSCLAAAGGLGDHKVRKGIESIYAKRNKAQTNKDFDFEKSLETEDYSEKGKDGLVKNRRQADAEHDYLVTMVTKVHEITTKVESVKPGEQENEFIVEVSERGSMTITGPDDKPHELIGSGRARDIWVRTEKGWKIKYHEDLGTTVTLDGKPAQ